MHASGLPSAPAGVAVEPGLDRQLVQPAHTQAAQVPPPAGHGARKEGPR